MERNKDNKDALGRPQSLYQTVNEEPTRTVQSQAHETDIATILSRHGVSGVMEHLNEAELTFGDVTEVQNYADSMRTLSEANAAFMDLPSKVREVFNHDVATWLDAANDGITVRQRDALVRRGFLEAPEEPSVQPPATVEPEPAPEPLPAAE